MRLCLHGRCSVLINVLKYVWAARLKSDMCTQQRPQPACVSSLFAWKHFASLAMRSSADSDQTARIWRLICVSAYFTKKCLYYFDPLKTPLLYSKTGVYRSIIIFLIFARKHRLWVLVRAVLTNTHSLYFRAKIRKYQSIYLKILSFWRWNFSTFEQACFHDGSAHVRRYVFWRYCSFSFLPRR